MAVAVIAASTFVAAAPAFAENVVQQVKDTVNNACANESNDPGGCPHI